ncbi:MAG TPA: DUF2231 domain-containing protein [Woeseiaceae bacterium]|nr:DUF2231 domain-containing protein [Woeseiaceae bacterium]
MQTDNPKSTAKIADHPIHPMLIPFPIAFLVAALVSDLLFWALGDAFWASASLYLLGAGIVMALVAALAGFTDFFGDPRIRSLSHAWQHMLGNLLAVAIAIANFFIRLGDPATAILPAGLILSAVVVLILLFTGWRGGDLVYKHRVGIPGP